MMKPLTTIFNSKPENILLSSTDNDCEVKIVDFGCARKATRDDSLKTHIGSHYYVSFCFVLRGFFAFMVYSFSFDWIFVDRSPPKF